MTLKKLVTNIILTLGIFTIGIVAFPQNTEAAKVEEVPNYYYQDYYHYEAAYSSTYGHTTKTLRFNNGYTRGSATKTFVSKALSTSKYKFTYSYYTY